MSLTELKKALKEKTITFGTEKTLKMLRDGKAKKVFISSNCPEATKETIEYYVKLNNIDLIKLRIPNDEIGLTCKKQFGISVLCY
ncbi:MAG: ribosomal L7Ae/L30e/S12e/Gadd45 family protein [Nanoarchaeota archaeon]|nr:ribosomal L7Ae/L30e/S12e/Gadd45 family protein [Nanoarchaeota archaeon]